MAHRMYVEGDRLVVEFEGLEVVEAIKRRLEFSLENITSVSTEPHGWWEGLRMGGTGLPGAIKEGRYVVNGKRVFFAMRHPERCVTVEFKDEPYDAIVVEVNDKEAVARELSRYVRRSVSG
ncbi:MAG TPA: hypothetical protein ENO38_01910 [Nitrososphaeria archaeon]|nr:hypothetical protein [Conexivisphaerales archaeon]HEU16411.1 hypothetical protein [Nitrososphaeria archaeon]